MSEAYYIAKNPELQPSEDFDGLLKKGIQLIEQLAHEQWTDYNPHDPGITLLEMLCYAITDLGYRTSYPIEDLLTQQRGGLIESLGDFHTARQVMTGNPVTFDDIAKLLIDVPGVRNAWVEANRDTAVCLDSASQTLTQCDGNRQGEQVLNGLYEVFLEYEDRVRDSAHPHHAGLLNRVRAEGAYIDTGSAGIRFDCERPIILESVAVHVEAAGKVVIRLANRRGRVLAETEQQVNQAGRKAIIRLGFEVPAGTGFKLDARGSEVKLYRNGSVADQVEFPFELERLITLRSGFRGSANSNSVYYFFYDWVIRYERGLGTDDELPRDVQLIRSEVNNAVRDRLQQVRNLCEDPVKLCELVPEEVAVCADLELKPGTDAEKALAEIFVRLRRHVSPPVLFYSLQEMRDKGRSSEEIFSGPALDHGFIDDEEFGLRRRLCEVRASDAMRIILEVEGVVAVHNLSLLAFEVEAEEPHAHETWLLPLSIERTRAPLFKWERSQIVFYQNKLPYYPDRGRTAVLLREHHDQAVRRRQVSATNSHDLPVPTGVDRSPETYFPVQNELPMTYRVGSYRVPESESATRHAQARQLKAYLLLFEQMLANYLSQLRHMYQLFSWQVGDDRTYFTQLVTGISDLDELFVAAVVDPVDRLEQLGTIIESEGLAADRRNQFLDHLLARFSEDFTDYSLLVTGLYGEDAGAARLIADKRAFLADFPRLSGFRGSAHDYRFPVEPENLSGYQRRLYGLLGFPEMLRRVLAGTELQILETAPGTEKPWQFLLHIDGGLSFESRSCETRTAVETLLDFALQLAGERASFRAAGTVFQLIVPRADDAEPAVLGQTLPGIELDTVIDFFTDLGDARGFHLVELILLRPRSELDPLLPVQLDDGSECPCVEITDPYSFRASIILPAWPAEFQDMRMRNFVEETLRRQAPAHLALRICWINYGQMQIFESRYRAWERSLAQLSSARPDCDNPPLSDQQKISYAEVLGDLIEIMYQLNNVHPLARLHDCDGSLGESPRVFLDHTNLGTF